MLTRKQVLLAQRNDTLDRLYADEVNVRIRARYTVGDELAILRQKDEKAEEYNNYFAYAEQCKVDVKAEIGEILGAAYAMS